MSTTAFRAKVALAALKGDKTLAVLAQYFDVQDHSTRAQRNRLLKIDKEFARLDGQRLRQLDDVLQSDIPFAALDTSDVVSVQTGPFGQFLLGIASLVAELPQPRAKSRLNGVWGHISMLGG